MDSFFIYYNIFYIKINVIISIYTIYFNSWLKFIVEPGQ